MFYTENVAYYLKLAKRERELVRAELKKYPAGELMISCEKDRTVYYCIYSDHGTRRRRKISSNKELINKLARKKYLLDYRDRLDECIAALSECASKLKQNAETNVIDRMPRNFGILPLELIVGPAMSSRKLQPVDSPDIQCNSLRLRITGISPEEWMTLPYRVNNYHSDEKIHKSSCSIMMRSKGEIAWAERLLHWGIAFHYDELIFFAGEWISPDFIVMRKDGKLFYIEHCGLMEDEKYRSRHKYKLRLYEQAGVVPWDNLIVTYDRPDGSIDVELIDAEIKSKLLI